MEIISIVYVIGVIVAISASVPQVTKLYKTKQSDEFQLSTWVTWTVTQTTSLVYVASIGNLLMTLANVCWVSFYVVMSYLIIRYRTPQQGKVARSVAVASPEVL